MTKNKKSTPGDDQVDSLGDTLPMHPVPDEVREENSQADRRHRKGAHLAGTKRVDTGADAKRGGGRDVQQAGNPERVSKRGPRRI